MTRKTSTSHTSHHFQLACRSSCRIFAIISSRSWRQFRGFENFFGGGCHFCHGSHKKKKVRHQEWVPKKKGFFQKSQVKSSSSSKKFGHQITRFLFFKSAVFFSCCLLSLFWTALRATSSRISSPRFFKSCVAAPRDPRGQAAPKACLVLVIHPPKQKKYR